MNITRLSKIVSQLAPEPKETKQLPAQTSSQVVTSLKSRSFASNDPLIGRSPLHKKLGQDVEDFQKTPAGARFDKDLGEFYRGHIASDNRRNIWRMEPKPGVGDARSAVYRFAKAESVAIVVGFKVPVPDGKGGHKGIQETDGPLGAAFMALGCLKTQKPVSMICDRETQPLVEACLRELGGEDAVRAVRFLSYEAQGESAKVVAEKIADKLAESRTDMLAVIETAGRNAEGQSLSMRGYDITHLNPDYDTLINTLGQQMDVVAIGDGGNEAGFGGSVTGVPPALNGKTMQAATGAGHVVPATVSNWGGYYMFAGLMRLADRPAHELPTRAQHDKAVQAMLDKGAVDGCTLSTDSNHRTSMQKNDTKELQQTGVDGMSIAHNGGIYLLAREFAKMGDTKFPVGKFQEWDKPVKVMMFDSSDGVLHAAQVSIPYLDAQLPGKKTYILLGDHGHAPYGTKTPEQIEQRVRESLRFLHGLSDAPVIMACNTACIALDRMENNNKIEVTDINLVKNTANVILKDPFERVGVLATNAMAGSGLYQKLLNEGQGDRPGKAFWVQGCTDWAESVNERMQEPALPPGTHKDVSLEQMHELVEAVITNALESLPPDLDALYLCCTHYPALTPQIEKAYNEKRQAAGITKPFVILDPMKRQAETASVRYAKGDFSEKVIDTPVPIIVLTTGDPEKVHTTALSVLKRNDIATAHVGDNKSFIVGADPKPLSKL